VSATAVRKEGQVNNTRSSILQHKNTPRKHFPPGGGGSRRNWHLQTLPSWRRAARGDTGIYKHVPPDGGHIMRAAA